MLQNSKDINHCLSQINPETKNDLLYIVPLTADTDSANLDTAKTITRSREQEDIFYNLCRIQRNNEWKVILELMMHKNAMMTTMPNDIVIMLIKK